MIYCGKFPNTCAVMCACVLCVSGHFGSGMGYPHTHTYTHTYACNDPKLTLFWISGGNAAVRFATECGWCTRTKAHSNMCVQNLFLFCIEFENLWLKICHLTITSVCQTHYCAWGQFTTKRRAGSTFILHSYIRMGICIPNRVCADSWNSISYLWS